MWDRKSTLVKTVFLIVYDHMKTTLLASVILRKIKTVRKSETEKEIGSGFTRCLFYY